jgi:hypothetical protein
MKSKILLFAALTFAAAIIMAIPVCTYAADDAPATAPATSPATQPDAATTKFYGTVTAVDTTAKTFTVGDQTFSIVDASKMTKADDSTATLADAVVGQPARGTYNKTADGKLEIVKVRFGKKAGGGKKGGKKKTDAPAATQGN